MPKCLMRMTLDPACIDMDVDQFRQFVVDQCFPPIYETLADLKAKKLTVEPVLDDQMRGGEGGIECHADTHGNAGCTVHGGWSW